MRTSRTLFTSVLIGLLGLAAMVWAAIGVGESPLFTLDTQRTADRPEFDVMPDTILVTALGGGQYQLQATVWNYGNARDNVPVRFVHTDLTVEHGEELIITTVTVSHIGSDSSAIAQCTWTPSTPYERLRIIIDPERTMNEYRYEDNTATASFGGSGGGRPTIQAISALWDGIPDNTIIGRFILGASFTNELMVQTADPDGISDVAQVSYIYNGQPHVVTSNVNGLFRHQFDVGEFTLADPRIRVVATDQSGLYSDTTVVSLALVPVPNWLVDSFGEISSPCVTEEFDNGTITIIATPIGCADFTDFLAQYTTPGDMTFLGNKTSSIEADVRIQFSYNILQDRASLGAGFELTGDKVLGRGLLNGRNASIAGDLNADVISQIDPITWDLINLQIDAEAAIDVRIPAWRLYYVIVPGFNAVLEISAQLGGYVEAQLIWAEVSQDHIELVPPTHITPGVDVGVTIAGKLEALFGVGGAALAATPTVIFDFPCEYTTATGTDWSFALDFAVPWELYVYCHLPFTQEQRRLIAEGEFGPWHLYENGLGNRREIERELSINWPDLLANPSLATDNSGNATLVWIGNSGLNGDIYPHVFYSSWDGVDWTEPDTVSDGTYGRLDPQVTYSGSTPVAVWTENQIPAADNSTPLDTILGKQEIYFSEFESGAWDAPTPLTTDNQPDGKAHLSVSPGGKKLVTWLHCNDNNFTTSTDVDVYYRFEESGTWGSTQNLTNNAEADGSARSAFINDSLAIAVWVNDVDGDIATYSDTRIKYALWSLSSGWTTPAFIQTVSAAPVQGTALTRLPSGRVALAWVTVNSIADTLNYWKLLSSIYDPFLDIWSQPDSVRVDSQQVSEPSVQGLVIGGQDIVQVVWRGFAGSHEDFFTSLRNIDAITPWTSAHNLTEDDFSTASAWMATAAVDANNNALLVNVSSNLDGAERSGPVGNLFGDLSFKAMGISSTLDLSTELNFGINRIEPDLYTHDTLIVFQQGAQDSILYADKDSTVTIKVLVKNIGVLPTTSTPVEFWRGHPDSISSVLISTANAPVVQPDSSCWISANWTAIVGMFDIWVALDPDSLTQDRNRYNNKRHGSISVIPDLSVTQVFAVNTNPAPADTFRIKAVLTNIGGANAASYWVRFFDGHPDSTGSTRLDSVQSTSLNRLAIDTVSFRYTAASGIHDIWVDVNRGGIAEETIANNRGSVELKVTPDLSVYPAGITYSQPDWNLNSTLQAMIHNEGSVSAAGFKVFFYDANPLIGGIVIDSVTIATLAGRDSSLAQITWHNTTLGLTALYVDVDPYDAMEDRNINNNRTSRDVVMLALPDLTTSEEDIQLDPLHPMLGDTVQVTVNVRNNGIGDALDNMVRSYQNHLDSTTFMLLDDIIYTIPYGSQRSLSFDWITDTLSAGVHTLWFHLDPSNIVQEGTDTNNVVGLSVLLMAESLQVVISYPTEDQIRLDWNPALGATHYKVYRDTICTVNPIPANLVGTASDTFFVNSGILLLPKDSYFYAVTASAGNPPAILFLDRPRREDYPHLER